jgi:hypothetical protein
LKEREGKDNDVIILYILNIAKYNIYIYIYIYIYATRRSTVLIVSLKEVLRCY